MQLKTIYVIATVLGCLSVPMEVSASGPAAREACKQFLTSRGYVVQDWGKSWDWTTIDNQDGSWSVGAKFFGAPPGGSPASVYVVCVANKKGDNWKLDKLSRMY